MNLIYHKDNWPCPCESEIMFSKCCKKKSNVSNTINYLLATITTCTRDSKIHADNGLWDSHKNNTLNLIKDTLCESEINYSEVAVLGAGNCNDIPLQFLAENFHRVDLYDIDWKAIKNAKRALPLSLQKKMYLL